MVPAANYSVTTVPYPASLDEPALIASGLSPTAPRQDSGAPLYSTPQAYRAALLLLHFVFVISAARLRFTAGLPHAWSQQQHALCS